MIGMTLQLDAFVQVLRRARIAAGMTQARLSEKAVNGLTPATVSRYEAGRAAPRDVALRAWAAVLGVPVPPDVCGRPEHVLAPHGTYARAVHEYKHDHERCPECVEAYRAYQREYHAVWRRFHGDITKVRAAMAAKRAATDNDGGNT